MPHFNTLIVNWFRQNARNLPWRSSNDPYKIWLSEIILQQTRVNQGLDYYIKFTEAFPTVFDLAAASEDEVLNLWQGLGYYSRARNLHYSAKYIVNDHQGKFPNSFESIKKLKGVGDYTAAAIASIAYNLPHAAIDGNVYRVLSRYLEIDTPIDSTKGKKEFQQVANELLNRNNPGDYNQGIMELGALICLPVNPKCDVCPVADSCSALMNKTQSNYPVKEKKLKVKNRYFNYLIISDNTSLFIKKREKGDIWQGLYDFPLIETSQAENTIQIEVEGLKNKNILKDIELKHILTHQKIYARFWIAQCKDLNTINSNKKWIKVNINELEDFPLPQLLIRYIESSPFFR